MKILVICQYFQPDITAAAFRMSDAAELLLQAGHEVRVITALPHRASAEGRAAENQALREAAVSRCPLQPLMGSGLVPYLRHYLSFVRGSVAAAWRIRKSGWVPDVIWASSPPLFTAMSGYAAAKIFRAPWVLDIRDIWPDSAVAAGQLREGGLAFRLGKRIERFFYHRASHITCVSEPIRKYIAALTKTSVAVVYNGVKSSEISLGQPGTAGSGAAPKVLLYAGNLGRVQGLEQLVSTVAELDRRGRMDGWVVHLVGAGAVRDQIAASVQQLKLEHRIMLRPPVARSAVAREVAAADALFLSLKPDPALRMTIPSKLFDCLAAGLPVVAGIAGEGAEIAQRTGGNIVYSPDDPQGLKNALETLFQKHDQLKKLALQNPGIVKASFTREQAVSILEGVLCEASLRSKGRRDAGTQGLKDQRTTRVQGCRTT
jgi:glycosyltransferase involved in cell wall biosynthesis